MKYGILLITKKNMKAFLAIKGPDEDEDEEENPIET
jgi:hypothetical protein